MKDISLISARRQKRLIYWKEWFLTHDRNEEKSLTEQEKQDLKLKISTYSLLISKMLASTDEKQVEECEQRLSTMERELTSFFEERRLMTSNIGLPSVSSKYS